MSGEKNNPRSSHYRRKLRVRMRAQDLPCGICKGRLGAIHYDEPSDAQHPLSFVIDEILPISRYREFGYDSREAAAKDPGNLQAAHWICNAKKGNKLSHEGNATLNKAIPHDGEW